MSMGFKVCHHCNDGEAEALYAVDEKIQWFCNECSAEWLEEPAVIQETPYERWMLLNYGEY